MDWLARLVARRPWRVVILAAAIVAAAGVLGAGVGDRLDPYGADDPGTESVIADQRLENAGFRKTGVVVLVDGVDPHSSQGRARVEAVVRRLETDGAVASASSFLTETSLVAAATAGSAIAGQLARGVARERADSLS